MSNYKDREEDVEEVESEVESGEESQEETYIETLTLEVLKENEDTIVAYVDDPQTPDEMAKNESIKKFMVQKVRTKLLESFEDQLHWVQDTDLIAMMKRWKKVTAKDEDLDPSTAMKRIIKENATIVETVEQQLEEMLEEDDEDDDEEDVQE
jgi:hypothetical protein